MRVLILVASAGVMFTACEQGGVDPKSRWTDNAAPASSPAALRWYTNEQVAAGAVLYKTHCASCHKENTEGTAEWRKRDANGKLPPPPLNGTAHTWHHSLDVLRTVVKRGGEPVGGSMPPFAEKLDRDEIDAILAWVQTHWSDEIYRLWRERDLAASGGMQAIR